MNEKSSSVIEQEKVIHEAFSNVGLAAELNLDLSGPLFQSAYSVVSQYVSRNGIGSVSRLHRFFPASTVLAISALAFEFGEGGEFWAKISEDSSSEYKLPFLNQQHQSDYGKAFRNSLVTLELATFGHVKGKPNLTPILLHAGLPVSSVRQVWNRLHEFIERGYEDGSEIVSLWRQDEYATQYFTIPAKRFIHESGRFAEDLIGRMVGVLIDLGDASDLDIDEVCRSNRVPKSLVLQLLSEDLSEIKRVKRVPYPRVEIDLLSGDGPRLLLPALDANYFDSEWRVTSTETNTYSVSKNDEQYVELEPTTRWSAELIRRGSRLKLREFRSVDGLNFWFFNSNSDICSLIDYSNAIEDESLRLLAPESTLVKIKFTESEELVSRAENYIMFGGVWTKYALFELPLFGAEELKLQLGGSTLSIPVIRAQGKPELFAEISREVSDLEGRKTFASIPSVRFTREVKNIEKYEITIYRASKIIFRSLLSELRNENGEFRLNDIFEWETGSYTVRILGPLGSDLVSAFVFMPNVRLDNLKQNYLPFENATVNLLIDGHPPALMEFPAGEDRITAELELESEVLQFRLRIPRFLFSICEPNDAPDFGSFITETTERDFLEELSNCNLHIRFRDSVKGKVQLGSRNELLHSKPFEIKDGIEVAKIELSDFRQDVQRSKSTSLEISVQLENSAIFTVAKIETEFDGAVKSFEANQVIDGQVTEIVFEIDESLCKHELQLVLKEINRPWNGLRIVPINERFCEFTPSGEDTYLVVAKLSEPIVPGKYQTGLAFLDSTKMINNTRNVVQFGTKSDLAIYLKTLNEDGLGIANGAVLGRPIPKRSLSVAEYQSGVNTVGQYLLFNTEAGNNSSEYKYAKEFLLHEGQTSALVSWFCDTLSDRSTKNQAEKLLISIFPQFCDSPLEGDDAQLRQRIWRTSPLVGAAMTYFLETPEVIQERNYWLGPMDDARVPVESYVSTRLSELKKVDQLQFQNQKILSTEYLKHVIIGFILRNSSSERVDALHVFNLEVDELLGDIMNKQKAFSTRLQRLEPFQIFTYRNASVLSKIPYNFYQLSLTIVDNSVPYVLADKAAVLLSNQLETGKELVMCSLLSALVETRVKSAQ